MKIDPIKKLSWNRVVCFFTTKKEKLMFGFLKICKRNFQKFRGIWVLGKMYVYMRVRVCVCVF